MKISGLKIYKAFVIVAAVGLLLWILPWLYSLLIPVEKGDSFVYYSPIVEDFITRSDGNFVDMQGNIYTQDETDSILPYFFYRQLLSEGRLPDTLFGEAMDTKVLRREQFTFKTSPAQLNKPRVPLYELLDSESGRVDLQLPEDVFRLTDKGIEFVTAETNKVNKDKSEMFTSVMKAHGFVFPANLVWGNPSTRKAYDNGYLLTDNEGKLFNLRMAKGSPIVKNVPLPDGVELIAVFVTEFDNMRNLGFAVDSEHRLYVVNRKTLRLERVGIPEYDPQEMQILMMGNMHDWTVRIFTATDTRYYALDATDYSLIKETVIPDPEPTGWRKAEKYIFPIRVSLTSWQSPTIFPRVNDL